MLRQTLSLLGSRAKGYNNREMVYAHRRQKARYLMPKQAHARNPLANKQPEEYGNTWDPRTGVEWMYRMRKRNEYRHWPWARWTDDPIHHHKDKTARRTFSAKQTSSNDGVPEFNYYAEVGQDYQVPSHFPLHYLAPFIYQYAGKVWTKSDIESYLKTIEQASQSSKKKNAKANAVGGEACAWDRTIGSVAEQIHAVREWNALTASIPHGLLEHVAMLSADVVLLNRKKEHRCKLQNSGVLRTADMQRYYALPYLRTTAVLPVNPEFVQPSGKYPAGKYSTMMEDMEISPLQVPDHLYSRNMYPA